MRNSAAPSNAVPSGRTPDASIGLNDSSTTRQRPMASKFSSAKPAGSIIAWQAAQAGLSRCACIRSRSVAVLACVLRSTSAGTFGGGSGGGVPRMLFRIHLPRSTGEVRMAWDVSVRMLPWPSSPRRGLPAGRGTRRKWLPCTFGTP